MAFVNITIVLNILHYAHAWVAVAAFVSVISLSNMKDIFSCQMLLEAICMYVVTFMQPTYSYSVSIRVGSEWKNLEIGLTVFCQEAK